SPMVFAFDHFVGFFAGTLYDTELGSVERLWTYRLATAGCVGCAYVWVAATRPWGTRRPMTVRSAALRSAALRSAALRSASLRSASLRYAAQWPSSRILGGVFSLLLVGVVYALGPRLGHFQTEWTILQTLKHHAETERCV